MNVLNGIQNFLSFIDANWTNIIIIIALCISIASKMKSYFSKSNDEKIEIAKAQIEQTVLKMITEAEFCYEDFKKSGEIKRSQVIDDIFKTYPILSRYVNQVELIEWIDNEIDKALDVLREIVKMNEEDEMENE